MSVSPCAAANSRHSAARARAWYGRSPIGHDCCHQCHRTPPPVPHHTVYCTLLSCASLYSEQQLVQLRSWLPRSTEAQSHSRVVMLSVVCSSRREKCLHNAGRRGTGGGESQAGKKGACRARCCNNLNFR